MTRLGPQPNEYLLGHSANEEERLRRQPQELAPDSKRLLDQLDIRPGDRAIDIGCGPQGILDLLSERVGARGRAVGLNGANRPFIWQGNSSPNMIYGM
jgi:tRNA A58 N-methylase Trm61